MTARYRPHPKPLSGRPRLHRDRHDAPRPSHTRVETPRVIRSPHTSTATPQGWHGPRMHAHTTCQQVVGSWPTRGRSTLSSSSSHPPTRPDKGSAAVGQGRQKQPPGKRCVRQQGEPCQPVAFGQLCWVLMPAKSAGMCRAPRRLPPGGAGGGMAANTAATPPRGGRHVSAPNKEGAT